MTFLYTGREPYIVTVSGGCRGRLLRSVGSNVVIAVRILVLAVNVCFTSNDRRRSATVAL